MSWKEKQKEKSKNFKTFVKKLLTQNPGKGEQVFRGRWREK